jgi:hypothetical protein
MTVGCVSVFILNKWREIPVTFVMTLILLTEMQLSQSLCYRG